MATSDSITARPGPPRSVAPTMATERGLTRGSSFMGMVCQLVKFCTMLVHHANRPGKPMKIVDLSHTMSIHTPGWVGYAGNKMYYAQNLQTVGIVAQRV